MANKNTRNLRSHVRAARRSQKDSFNHSRPVPNYHSTGSMTSTTVPVLASGADSPSPKRNMIQRVLVNTDNRGKRYSVTVHEPENPKEKFRPFLRHKQRTDKDGVTHGLSAPHQWVYPGDNVGRVSRSTVG